MEDLHGVKYFSLKMVNKYVEENENNPRAAKDLMKLILSEDENLSMRASWTLQHLCFKKPEVIYPLLPDLIKFLKKSNQHTGSIRNVIRIFQEIELPEKYCSEIFDLCLKYAKNAGMPHAVRVFSIYVLTKICLMYPELKHEVELILSELREHPQPPSLMACIRTTTKKLLKLERAAFSKVKKQKR
jgi:hypothetical protein